MYQNNIVKKEMRQGHAEKNHRILFSYGETIKNKKILSETEVC